MWTIAETLNTVKISAKCARELFEAQEDGEEIWYSLENVTYKGKLTFNPDHNEHMDFLRRDDKYVSILRRHKVKGDICFGSLDGDNAGEFWGYRFDGKGGMKRLTGRLEYREKK
ncbi:MAG: hypothetical protein HZB99_00210 [Candidatus Harrisonbacteria bacterium]|nr:hypothetical protein [Candidatus Harrisonbacteria bacterium]